MTWAYRRETRRDLAKVGSVSLRSGESLALDVDSLQILVGLGKLDKALPATEAALVSNPDDPGLWCIWTRCVAETKDHRLAKYGIRRALQADPTYLDAFFLLTWWKRSHWDFKGAQDTCRAGLASVPHDRGLQQDLAEIERTMRRLRRPWSPEAWRDDAGQKKLNVEQLDAQIRNDPSNGLLLYERSRRAYGSGQLTEAGTYLQAAVRADPRLAGANAFDAMQRGFPIRFLLLPLGVAFLALPARAFLEDPVVLSTWLCLVVVSWWPTASHSRRVEQSMPEGFLAANKEAGKAANRAAVRERKAHYTIFTPPQRGDSPLQWVVRAALLLVVGFFVTSLVQSSADTGEAIPFQDGCFTIVHADGTVTCN